ncbi:tyrosine-protein kinase receptor isoform X2 [Syngnathoides biaculeatus]|uniref:tyrosine-protein kinase receptor isoform X2 n=1 Tax=Syngnathoides biaculeatus TaxID=300417 RepID=UPI002ADD7563|nr:tyrosine-protein kinase receptor isoform X2 [Syngnathoides biaculeatus]
MDRVKKPSLRLLLHVAVLLFCSHCHNLPGSFPEDRPDQQRPRHSDSQEDSRFSSCDFESPCLWTLSNDSQQTEWLVASARQTRRAGRMPEADHSEGSADGHFLLLSPPTGTEASRRCEYLLTSPIVPRSEHGCVLRLALYETLPSAGNLTVRIEPLHSGSFVDAVVLKPERRDQERTEWEAVETGIGPVDGPFQVTLRYIGCVQDGSTVALDSLHFVNCEADKEDEVIPPKVDCGDNFYCEHSEYCIEREHLCDFHTDCPLGEDEGFICGSMPLGSHCSFEQDACGWSLSNQQSSWKRVAGDDLLQREDMQGLTLSSTHGYFLFLEIRETHTLQEAFVQSPFFHPPVANNTCQMRFSFYLFGSFNGSLSVVIEENGTSAASQIWEGHGRWKDDWEHVVLQLTDLHHGFRIKVTAVWLQGSDADVALDNIAMAATCFDTDLSSLVPMADLRDFFSPVAEPSLSEASLMMWFFNPCGASGPHGPTQAQCDSTYRNKNVNVTVGKEGPLKGVQMWRVPATNRYLISAYGAAGGKGAKNHIKRNHGIFISAVFPLEKGELLYILVGHQGEDACPGRNLQTQKICLGESFVIDERREAGTEWSGGGGGGGGATFVFKMDGDKMVPLLIAAGGGGNAYMEDLESSLDQVPLEQFENSTTAPGTNGQTGAAGGGGGWKDAPTANLVAGRSLAEGADGGAACLLSQSKLGWSTNGGFGGGGGACTAGGGGGGYRGGDAVLTDDMKADGRDGISFINPNGEMYLQPLAVMESHGECEIEVVQNCSHCQSQSCKQDEVTHLILCLCHNDKVLASDNVTCVDTVAPAVPPPPDQMSTTLVLAVVTSTVVSGVALICVGIILMWHRWKNDLQAVRGRLHIPEYKLSKIRSSTIMTDYNPNYCFAGKASALSELKEVPRKNITLFRALGHGAFGEVYEGQVLGMNADNGPMQVAIKTLPEICSEQDEMDFLMEALIMSKFNHENIVRCIGVSLNILPRFILLELMTGGDMKSFLRQNRPRRGQPPSLSMHELLQMARDIAHGCRYLEENHFIHRDIAARNCLLTCPGLERVAKIGDFGMARDIYRASYYRKGGRAMLPVKWMPPEAFMEGIFTCKTDTWSFGILLWEILSLGYMPYPCKTNQEVLEFVTSGGRMDPPEGCPGPVYRIMTQCWQHCPEYRPNFSTILERINYCTQDPDVINTPLPVEYRPTADDDSAGAISSSDHRPTSFAPLPVSLDSSSPLSPAPPAFLPQPAKPHLLLEKGPPVKHEATSCRESVPESSRAEAVPAGPLCAKGFWVHPEPPLHQPCSRKGSCSGSQQLKNKTKNLWNPTYGSWILESFKGKKTLTHTRSVPLSGSPSPSCKAAASECNRAGCENSNCSHLKPPSLTTSASPSYQGQAALSVSHTKGQSGGPPSKAGIDLAKLQSFPCGNVNYAYDEQNYEGESLPLVVQAKAPEAIKNTSSAPSMSSGTGLGLALGLHTSSSSSSSSSFIPKLLLKRHASYGHEDVRRHAKAEKPTRDRDSGFSLSEDLSVTPT